MRALKVLLVEDSRFDAELVTVLLAEADADAQVEVCATLAQAREQLRTGAFDVAVADLSLPDAVELEAVRAVRDAAPELPLVVLTGRDDEATALDALAAGAQDYVSKNELTGTLLVRSLRYAQERAHADRALRTSARLSAALLDGLEAPTCAVGRDGRVVAVNAALRAGDRSLVLSTPVGESLTAAWSAPDAPRAARSLLAGLQDVLEGRSVRFEHEHQDPDGRWWSVRTTPLPGGQGAVVMQVDVTALKDAQDQLTAAALHDPLTGLPNRALLRDRLSQAFETARRAEQVVAVVFLDLDRFKLVNDTLGHAAGDAVLVSVAERLAGAARSSDTVARVSGDEYVVVCVADDELHAGTIAARLVRAVNDVVLVEGRRVAVTASAGLAVALPSDSVDEVIQVADEAMYAAKARGGGCMSIATDEMRGLLTRRLQAEHALEQALTDDRIEVHFQPVVRLHDGSVRGVEALVRLRDLSGRLVPPAEFIDVAERSGLIVGLGRRVLDIACAQAASWTGATAGLTVAVNLSTRQLAQPDVVETVRDSLQVSGLEPSRLVLEVTESAVVEDAEAALAALRALKALGVRTAIDDFGTGYSSFLYLKQFPVDFLKIDRSFVDGMLENPDDAAIVASIVRLGRDIGVTLVAEGIETEAQHRQLLGLGCDEAQGYRFSPPVPAADLAAALEQAVLAVPPRPDLTLSPAALPLDDEATERIAELSRAGASLNTIAAALNSEGLRSPTGRRWHPRAVARQLSSSVDTRSARTAG